MSAPAPGTHDAASRAAVHAADTAPGSAIALAEAVAGAVRGVAGVAALSAGRGVEAATYGPGRRVVGVVVDRSAAASPRLGIHIVVSRHHLVRMRQRLASDEDAPGASPAPLLLALAAEVRAAAQATAHAAGIAAESVDVFIDDIE